MRMCASPAMPRCSADNPVLRAPMRLPEVAVLFGRELVTSRPTPKDVRRTERVVFFVKACDTFPHTCDPGVAPSYVCRNQWMTRERSLFYLMRSRDRGVWLVGSRLVSREPRHVEQCARFTCK